MKRLIIIAVLGVLCHDKLVAGGQLRGRKTMSVDSAETPPNIIVFMVDDLGFNQVGFHANKVGNMEVHTPKIDEYANRGIEMNRGYMSPWCAPSRAAFVTGTTYSFNQAQINDLYSFDENIGFASGIPAGISSVAQGLKNVHNYTATYAGKWGIGGSAWMNTPMGAGFDESRVFWGDSIEACDGYVDQASVPGTLGGIMRTVQGYFEQTREISTRNEWCDIIQNVSSETLSDIEKDIACKTTPRTPPKLMDLDLMDYARNIITGHDYESGPLFHFHATQIAHLPMRYPKYYDDVPIEENPVPPSFQDGQVKPPGDNDIVRKKTNNLLRYMDDLFGDLMQAIKDAGQWENTIVLFTSDNGGAVFPNGQANQNYPLRGSKRSNFDGGLRVAQFLTGGWIEKHTHSEPGKKSDTYMFMNDWASTFVQMAGGDSQKDLFGSALGSDLDTSGPAYGKEMWEYIKSSVEPSQAETSETKSYQLPRRILYTPEMSFEVKEDATYKFFWTDERKNLYINKWEPVWPKGNDYIPDFAAISVNPCRKSRDEPMSCCLIDVENDPEEDYPILDAECEAMLVQNKEEWNSGVSQLCEAKPQFEGLCITAQNRSTTMPLPNFEQGTYSLWTWQKGAGPFLNSTGYPITNFGKYNGTIDDNIFSTKCACEIIDDGIEQGEVDAFFSTVQTPSVCVKKSDYPVQDCNGGPCAVDCSGGFTQLPQSGWLEAYEKQGVNKTLLAEIAMIERTKGTSSIPIPRLYELMHGYFFREGFTEWADLYKWPNVALTDTCVSKGVTVIPPSRTAITPWNVDVGDSTSRVSGSNLASSYNSTHCWCEAMQNPLQQNYIEFSPDGSWVKMENETDGSIVTLYPWPKHRCDTECQAQAGGGVGTAFISANGQKGIDA